jgi:hypothetical protein
MGSQVPTVTPYRRALDRLYSHAVLSGAYPHSSPAIHFDTGPGFLLQNTFTPNSSSLRISPVSCRRFLGLVGFNETSCSWPLPASDLPSACYWSKQGSGLFRGLQAASLLLFLCLPLKSYRLEGLAVSDFHRMVTTGLLGTP